MPKLSGKTAGNTLGCLFGFVATKCYHKMKLLPGKLPQVTTQMMHGNFDSCEREPIGIYLVTLRDPLQRLNSWFRYERPNNETTRHRLRKVEPLYIDCAFETMNQLGEAMSEKATKCSKVAWDAVTGARGFAYHNAMNYGFYWNKIPEEARDWGRIVVIRTEHLEQDWSSVERVSLAGDVETSSSSTTEPDNTTTITTHFSKKNASVKKDQDSYLSELAQQNICAGLCHEIQVYKTILHRAENLSPDDVAISMKELQQSCPVEAAAEQCPSTA